MAVSATPDKLELCFLARSKGQYQGKCTANLVIIHMVIWEKYKDKVQKMVNFLIVVIFLTCCRRHP